MARAGIGDRVEGRHAVMAALAAGRVEELWYDLDQHDPIVATALRAGITCHRVSDLRSLATITAPQGVVARCTPRRTVTLEELIEPAPAAVVALDHVEDPHNLGAVARSAAAAGMSGMLVPQRRSAPFSAAAFKAAAGALEHLPVAMVGSMAEGLRELQRLGLWVVVLEAGGEPSLFDQPILTEPVALVVGGEEAGAGRLVRRRADLVVGIPMAGGSESLNVSVAAALACFEVMRQRRD
jgi:23S rRNA (guanosine2251-2'-O)-methyltransferase